MLTICGIGQIENGQEPIEKDGEIYGWVLGRPYHRLLVVRGGGSSCGFPQLQLFQILV